MRSRSSGSPITKARQLSLVRPSLVERADDSVKIVKADLTMKVDEDFKDQTIEEIAEGELEVRDSGLSRRIAGELAKICAHLA